MNYEKMLFFPKVEMSSINSFAAPQPPQQSSGSTSTTASSATFLLPPETYASYADNFDLSLLPLECDLEKSTEPSTSHLPSQTSLEYIPTTAYSHTTTHPTTSTATPEVKTEGTWPNTAAAAESIKHETPQSPAVIFEQLQQQRHQTVQRTKSASLLIPPPPYPNPYPSPDSSPTQSDYSFHAQFSSLSAHSSLSSSRRSSSSLCPPSPCPSLDTTLIKQEFHILPPSPPESSCGAPSPHSFAADIKNEPLDAVETLIDINSLLESTYNHFERTSGPPDPEQKVKQEDSTQCLQQDHQVLREYLEDTTFQKKHNLKPLALESLIGGLGARGDIEPVISLALEYAKREAEETCAKLQISPDPKTWSTAQTHAWLRSTIEQFKLQPIDDLEMKFPEDGATLALLSEEEFMRRAPETGSTIHAQLEIWKLAYSNGFQHSEYAASASPDNAHSNAGNGASAWPPECGHNCSELRMDEGSEDEDDEDDDAPPPVTVMSAANSPPTTAPLTAKPLTATPTRNGGAHIHLWQFLKELLAAPHVNGTAIRWIERSRGIFKIEDSVRVAKLWGRRKNRPAMNYDKLSRSIRQYYKKGIMKKTERSQRLVYQFCHPYNL